MIKTSEQYKQIMQRPIRNRGYSRVELNFVNYVAQDGLVLDTTGARWSKGTIIGFANNSTTYATFEDNYTPCDGSFTFASSSSSWTPLNNGFTTADFYGSLTLRVENESDISGITIDFGECYPTEFYIAVNGDEMYYFVNDRRVFTTDKITHISNSIVITPTKFVTEGSSKLLHVKSILLGNREIFYNDSIKQIDIEKFVSPISTECSYANATIKIYDHDDKYALENIDSEKFESGLPVDIFFGLELDDENIEWHKTHRFWLKDWSSHNQELSFSCTDRMSQQEDTYESGYTNVRRFLGDELEKIFYSCGFAKDDFSISESLYHYYLDNPVPKVAQKDAVQLLCNAFCCISYEDENGVIIVKPNMEKSLDITDVTVHCARATAYSNALNALRGTSKMYADFSTNMIRADGSTIFIDNTFGSIAGYVSDAIANQYGYFDNAIYVTYTFPKDMDYKGITITFGNPLPKNVKVTTYDTNAVKIEEMTIMDVSTNVYVLEHDFTPFRQIMFQCNKTEPYARFVIDKINFKDVESYTITQDALKENPTGYKDQNVKKVIVPNYSNTLEGDTYKQTVDTNTEVAIKKSGVSILCENPITYLRINARQLAQWLSKYYESGLSYDVDWRGDPCLQVSDIINLETKYGIITTEIEKICLSYNGTWSSTLSLRKIASTENIANATTFSRSI